MLLTDLARKLNEAEYARFPTSNLAYRVEDDRVVAYLYRTPHRTSLVHTVNHPVAYLERFNAISGKLPRSFSSIDDWNSLCDPHRTTNYTPTPPKPRPISQTLSETRAIIDKLTPRPTIWRRFRNWLSLST